MLGCYTRLLGPHSPGVEVSQSHIHICSCSGLYRTGGDESMIIDANSGLAMANMDQWWRLHQEKKDVLQFEWNQSPLAPLRTISSNFIDLSAFGNRSFKYDVLL